VKKKRAILVIFLSCLLALASLAFFGIRRTRIQRRLWDLLPIIRNHIYHPAFGEIDA